MLTRILTYFLFASFLMACSGGVGNKPAADTVAAKSPSPQTHDHRDDDHRVVHADEKSLTDEYNGPAYILFGKEVTCRYEEIPARLKDLMPGLMKAATESKAVLTGSYMLALKEYPSAGATIPVFIGLPVKSAVKSSAYTTLQIPARKYIRHQLTAEPGTALSAHQLVIHPLGKKELGSGLPILETYAETRNNEMTSVISKATFLYPRP